MEGRLLHAKDSLALWDTKAVELEALSENALVLILELEHPGN
jgi:quercetin 2,3-dioxygenase